MEPGLLTLEETARFLRLGRTTTHTLIKRGELPSVRIGHSLRIPTAALRKWIERRTTATQPEPTNAG